VRLTDNPAPDKEDKVFNKKLADSIYAEFLNSADTASNAAYAEWKRLLNERDHARSVVDKAYNALLELAAEMNTQGNRVEADLRARYTEAQTNYDEAKSEEQNASIKADEAGDFYTKVNTARNVVKMIVFR
jgi:hypothetical protein